MPKKLENIRVIVILVFLICLSFCSCENISQNSDSYKIHKLSLYKKKNFDSLLRNVEQIMPSLDTYKALILNKSFVEIFKHSESYLQEVEHSLLNDKFSVNEAVIYVFAMQSLPLKDYLKLCRIYWKLYAEKKISEQVFTLIFAHDFLYKNQLGNNYNNKEVVSLLNQIIKDRNTSPGVRRIIIDILDGNERNKI